MSESNPNTVTISVVIAAYNAAKYIRETLDSVLAQTYLPLEVIVVDDGSTDETAAIVRSYAGRVRLLQQENRGEPAARNVGIRNAQGDYIAFVDSDDLWMPEKLKLQTARLLEKKVVWVTCYADSFDDSSGRILSGYKKKLYEGDILEKEFANPFIRSPTPVVKKTVFEEVGYFDEDKDALIGEDKNMWMRIAAHYPLGAVYQVLALKREHPTSALSSTPTEEKLKGQLCLIERNVSRQPQRLARYKNRVLARIYLNNGTDLLKQGEYERARLLIDKAQQLNPFSFQVEVYWLILHSGEIGRKGYRLYRELKTRMV